jgi:hypothetical protein
VLLGGGARTTPASAGSTKPIASYPTFYNAAHDYGQKAAADGDTNPDSWAAVGWAAGGSGNTTYAYAICLRRNPGCENRGALRRRNRGQRLPRPPRNEHTTKEPTRRRLGKTDNKSNVDTSALRTPVERLITYFKPWADLPHRLPSSLRHLPAIL